MRHYVLLFLSFSILSSKMIAWSCIKRSVCSCNRFKKCYLPLTGAFKPCFSDIDVMEQMDEKIEYLNDVEYKDTVGFVPPIMVGKVIKVYDGDTITIASKLPNTETPIYRFSVRLSGIDSAEIHGKTPNEKKKAIIARDKLNELIFGKMVHLKNISTEKYGRMLADVYLDNLHINQWMLDNKFAVPYDGGTKHRPTEWDNEL
jgi:endonuclease YncB( thermonuclease family)